MKGSTPLRRWRELTREEIACAQESLRAWGYPRELDADDIDSSIWARWGPDALVWWMPVGFDTYSVHVCFAPSARQRTGLEFRRFLQGLDLIGEFLGGKRLVALPIDNTRALIHDLGLRAGWELEGDMLVRELQEG